MLQLSRLYKLVLPIILLLGTATTMLACSINVPDTNLAGAANSMVNHNLVQQEEVEGTAVLFLIDESAGMNDRCPNTVDSDEIIVVDKEQQFRYELPRFFLTLWQTYYSLDNWYVDKDNDSQIPQLPNLHVGVSQFAQDYQPLLPMTAIEQLSHGGSQEGESNSHLINEEYALANRSLDWSCATNYEIAVTEAITTLNETGLKDLHLILITDGLFRGHEDDHPNEDDRSAAANSFQQDVISQLENSGISVSVILLGANSCVQSGQDDCDRLANDIEINIRQNDIERWRAWSNLLNIIDDSDIFFRFKTIGEQLSTVMPSGFDGQWVNGSNDLDDISGRSNETKIAIVSSKPLSQPPTVRYYENDSLSQSLQPLLPSLGSNGLNQSFGANLVLKPLKNICNIYTPKVEFYDTEIVAYVWQDANMDDPRLRPPILSANSVIVNAQNNLTVTAVLDPDKFPQNPDCYNIVFQLDDMVVRYSFPKDSDTPVSHIFTLPDTMSWGQHTVFTQLVSKNSPTDTSVLSSAFALVDMSYEISVPDSHKEVEEELQGINGEWQSTWVTVPIQYALKVPDESEFQPRFGLFPVAPKDLMSCEVSKPDTDLETEEGTACYPLDSAELASTIISTKTESILSNAVLYTVNFPFRTIREDGCDFRHLRVRWQDPLNSIERCQWLVITLEPPADVDVDGILDEDDRCPKEFGSEEHKGCPDADGDNTPDVDDRCPKELGSEEFKGCPDADGDDIPDIDDKCQKDPGNIKKEGCPISPLGDAISIGVIAIMIIAIVVVMSWVGYTIYRKQKHG